jgi:hypothetical protein
METSMRKPRDFDSELKALADKAKQLKERRVQQLGELVIATGADATDAETLAGALLVIAETSDAQRRRRGASAALPSFKQGAQAWRWNSRPAGRHSPA